MSFSLHEIIQLLLAYKYFFLFPVAVLEGPIITVLAGFIVSLGKMNFLIAYIVIVCADVVGDLLYYGIGRWGGKPFLNKFGKYIGASVERVEKMEVTFLKHSKKTLLFGKFSHAFGMVILLSAGAVKEKVWEFVWVNMLGTLVKSFFLILVGYYFGYAYERINNYITDYVYIVVVLVVVLVGAYYLISHFTKKYFNDPK